MKLLIAGFVGILTFIVYLPALQNEFIDWDDSEYVYENPFIRSLDARLLRSAFLTFYFTYWHPLTWISHALDYALWGLNPMGHHLTNNILHSLNAALVTLLMMRMMEEFTKNQDTQRGESFLNNRTTGVTGAVTGLLFGLHPLHVESVAWVAERKDVLCAFFFLSSIMMYTYYVSASNAKGLARSPARFFNRNYLFTLGLFVLALLSKPMAVTLPFVLLILDWLLYKRIQSQGAVWAVFTEKLPFFALSLGLSIITIAATEAASAIVSIKGIPLTSRIIVAGQSLVTYLTKIIVPINLVPFYPYPKDISLFSLKYIVPIIMVIAITMACIAAIQSRKIWISAWGYFVVTLMPVLGIIQAGEQSMADRYTYLPGLGPFLIIGLATAKAYEKIEASGRWQMMLRIAGIVVAMTMLVSMSYATIRQIGIWKNSIIFWSYVIEKEPGRIPVAYNNLGNAFQSKGLINKAIEQYHIALQVNPNYANAHFNLGLIYLSNGALDRARTEFELGLQSKPDNYKARQMLNYINSKKN